MFLPGQESRLTIIAKLFALLTRFNKGEGSITLELKRGPKDLRLFTVFGDQG
jgi:hypothetical protein